MPETVQRLVRGPLVYGRGIAYRPTALLHHLRRLLFDQLIHQRLEPFGVFLNLILQARQLRTVGR